MAYPHQAIPYLAVPLHHRLDCGGHAPVPASLNDFKVIKNKKLIDQSKECWGQPEELPQAESFRYVEYL